MRTETAVMHALERRLQGVAASAQGMVFTFRQDADGSWAVPYASPRIRDIYGVTADQVRDDAAAIMTRIHHDDVAHVRRHGDRVGGEPVGLGRPVSG